MANTPKMVKVKLIRNILDTWTLDEHNVPLRVMRFAGEEVEIPEKKYQDLLKAEEKAGPDFLPYFAGTEETQKYLAERDKRRAKVRAENYRRGLAKITLPEK